MTHLLNYLYVRKGTYLFHMKIYIQRTNDLQYSNVALSSQKHFEDEQRSFAKRVNFLNRKKISPENVFVVIRFSLCTKNFNFR